MRSKILVILLSTVVSIILLHGIDYAGCLIRTCEADDASIRASDMLGFIPLLAYMACSWLLVFPSMLFVRKWLGYFGAVITISLAFALAITWLLYSPAVDASFFKTAQLLLPWFAFPWFFGGLVALAFWPNIHEALNYSNE
jgi:hypothetical protein